MKRKLNFERRRDQFGSINSRQKIVDTMIEQREKLEMLYTNEIVDEQNRILRQINDFIVVVSNILCRHVDTQVFKRTIKSLDWNVFQSLDELPTDLIERLQYLSNLIQTTLENEPTNEDVNSFY